LTRAGCNQGACHGSQFGKGGFKLSLAAYDPDFDYIQITRQAGGRRVTRLMPAESLLLKKPALAVAHVGGLKIPKATRDYRTILAWIAQGMAGPNPNDPTVIALNTFPEQRVLSPGQSVRLVVRARYSNGTVRDVTEHARIGSLNDMIAPATPEGVVTVKGRGATAIMVRYAGLATVAHISVPYASAKAVTPLPDQWKSVSFVDRAAEKRWRDLGLTPSPPASDSDFLRRAYLDITGTLPSPEMVKSFLADRRSVKRTELVDRLLDSQEYSDYWAVKWGDLLRISRSTLGAKSMWSLNAWLRDSLARNVPYDRMVRELLTSQGSANSVGPANYYRVAATPQDLTETTAQLFLGIRLQCAKCHHHPFEKWSQRDYYQFAAFFARVGTRPSADGSADSVVRLLTSGEVTHPKTGKAMVPTPLALDDGPLLANIPSAYIDRRELLADWLTSRNNLPFAKMIVNRYWGALMGRGIVDPVDDMRVTNPPSNPELLDSLARDFIKHGYDLKRLVRVICTSNVYQLSSQATSQNRADQTFYSHYMARRLPAEVLLDAVSAATGVPQKFADLPSGMRAIQLPDGQVASPFLDTFGRPPRSTACECERLSEPTLAQSLQLLSGDDVAKKVASPQGRAAYISEHAKNNGEIVDGLYLSAVCRFPTPSERTIALDAFSKAASRRAAAEDLLWALINTQEFSFVR